MENFQQLQVYQLAEKISNQIWFIVKEWDYFTKDTMGKQIVRSADSVGANIAEGHGRHSYQDNQRFVKIARGSLNETRHWLRLAYARNLLTQEQSDRLHPLLNELSPKLNAYLNSLKQKANSQQPTANRQQPTANSQPSTVNRQQPTVNRQLTNDSNLQSNWNQSQEWADRRIRSPADSFDTGIRLN